MDRRHCAWLEALWQAGLPIDDGIVDIAAARDVLECSVDVSLPGESERSIYHGPLGRLARGPTGRAS